MLLITRSYTHTNYIFALCLVLFALGAFWVPDGAEAFVPGNLVTKVVTLGTGRYHINILKRAIRRSIKQFFNDQLKLENKELITTQDKQLKIKHMYKSFYGSNYDRSTLDEALLQMQTKIASVDADELTKDNPKYHFDAEHFDAANKLLIDEMLQVLTLLRQRKIDAARKTAGIMFHTLQDFYAHSNWVEIHRFHGISPVPINENLGKLGHNIGVVAEPNQPTCRDCEDTTCRLNNLLPQVLQDRILTSGYYSGQADDNGTPVLKPSAKADGSGKCSHGGSLDSTKQESPRGGISKDGSLFYTSPHHELHFEAAAVAEDATVAHLAYIRRLIGDERFADFLGLWPQQNTVSIVTPTADLQTSSVQRIRRSLSSPSSSILSDLLRSIGSSGRVHYNVIDGSGNVLNVDGTVVAPTVQQTMKSGHHKARGLKSGGQSLVHVDRLSMHALISAIESVDEGGRVLVLQQRNSQLTDMYLADFVTELARDKHVTITFVDEESADATKANTRRRRNDGSTLSNNANIVARLVKETGGHVIDAANVEERELLQEMTGNAGINAVVLVSLDDVIDRNRLIEFHVDSSILELRVFVNSDDSSGQLPEIVVDPPDASDANSDNNVDIVKHKETNINKKSGKLLMRIRSPVVGKWTIKLWANQPWDLRIEATSAADFSFSMLRTTNKTHDRDDASVEHSQAALELADKPTIGERITMTVKPTNNLLQFCHPTRVTLYSSNGYALITRKLISSAKRSDDGSRDASRFFTEMTVPKQNFRVAIAAICNGNSSGEILERMRPVSVTPSGIKLRSMLPLNLPLTLEPGAVRTLNFRLTSIEGGLGRVTFLAMNQLNMIVDYPKSVGIGAEPNSDGIGITVPVKIQVPLSAVVGSVSTVELMATVYAPVKQTVLQKVTIIIGPNELIPPTCSIRSNSWKATCQGLSGHESCTARSWASKLSIETHSGGLEQILLHDGNGGEPPLKWNHLEPTKVSEGKSIDIVGVKGSCCVRTGALVVVDRLGLQSNCVL